MFRQLKNIETAFKHIRLFSLILILACMAICCYTVYACMKEISIERKQVYVLTNGKLLKALASDRKNNIAIEMRDHIRMFHHYFFTLDPDETVILDHITKALYLADASAVKRYNNLKEKGFFRSVIAANITQRISTDSIQLDLDRKPYYFRYYGKITITRTTSKVIRNLVTEGYLRETSRSDHNPHGFLIERWRILENKNLKISHRE